MGEGRYGGRYSRSVCSIPRCPGRLLDAKKGLVRIDQGLLQLMEPWSGGDLWVIRAFVAKGDEGALNKKREQMESEGFEFGTLGVSCPVDGGLVSKEEGSKARCRSIGGDALCEANKAPESDAEKRLWDSVPQESWELRVQLNGNWFKAARMIPCGF